MVVFMVVSLRGGYDSAPGGDAADAVNGVPTTLHATRF